MNIVLVVIIVILSLAIRLYGPTFLTRRALKPVISSFKRQGAMSAETALAPDQLDILQKTGVARYTRMGMYRQKALEALQQTDLIKVTEDERLYLDVDSLMASKLIERWPSLSDGIDKHIKE